MTSPSLKLDVFIYTHDHRDKYQIPCDFSYCWQEALPKSTLSCFKWVWRLYVYIYLKMKFRELLKNSRMGTDPRGPCFLP